MSPEVRVKRVGSVEVPLPAYQTEGAAGLDLCLAATAPVTIPPGARARLATGLAMSIPHGFEGQVRPRSGLAAKHGLTVLNAPGTIDWDYRGEIQVLLVNHGEAPVTLAPLDRIAQLVVAPVTRATLVWGDLDDTERGSGGYGSTGA